MISENQAAPDFTLSADDGSAIKLSAFKGQKVVLYFYPKDDTPGCTTEACDFRDNLARLQSHGVQIFGVSKDTVASHQKFKQKYQLNFPLLADTEGKVCDAYGVMGEKSMYGKKYMGIMRSTFLIDETGKVQRVWHNVNVKGHVTDILAAIQT